MHPTHLDGRGVKHVEAAVLIGIVNELVEVLVPNVGVLELEVAVTFVCCVMAGRQCSAWTQ